MLINRWVSGGVPKLGNMVLEAPRLEVVNFIKECNEELTGFWRCAQNRKYASGDAKAGNIKFIKEVS